MKIVLLGEPRTKKNSGRILYDRRTGRRFVAPSVQYIDYERDCLKQLAKTGRLTEPPYNVKCLYYMPTRRKVDLVNLLEATMDILVHGGILADDDSKTVAGHDGSRVLYDRERPRVEIEIEKIICR